MNIIFTSFLFVLQNVSGKHEDSLGNLPDTDLGFMVPGLQGNKKTKVMFVSTTAFNLNGLN